jgi:two-component sensor histidine kinase
VRGALKTYSLEKRYRRKDGSAAWLAVSATAVFDEEGRFRYSVRVIQDIDQRKRHEQRQALLVRELHHRVRNTLATVQALAGATARSTTSISEFTRSFSARPAALAKTHALLTEDYWQTIPLREMLLNELQPFHERKRQRFTLAGPDVDLSADLAIPLSMALHELTANAARYGPAVEAPAHRGFGMVLLERVLPARCDAQVRLSFHADGLRFELDAPLITHRHVPQY